MCNFLFFLIYLLKVIYYELFFLDISSLWGLLAFSKIKANVNAIDYRKSNHVKINFEDGDHQDLMK